MFGKNTVFRRAIAIVVIVQFVLTGAPMRSFALRTPSPLTDGGRTTLSSMEKDLDAQTRQDGGTGMFKEAWIGVNTFSLRLGKATGFIDIANIIKALAQVIYINHSEERAQIELRMKIMIKSVIAAFGASGALVREEIWDPALEMEGLSKDDIAVTAPWFREFVKDYYRLSEKERDERIATVTRQLTNQIQHVKFRELLKTAEEFEKKFGFNPLKQIVLCVGETQAERNRVMKKPGKDADAEDLAAGQEEAKRIVNEDFSRIILGYKEGDSIDLKLLEKYNFRVANEARTLIGKTGEIKDWQLDQALDINQYIMEDLAVKVLGHEIPVDYGAGTDAELVRKIGASKYVSGWLIGTAGKVAKSLKEIIDACNEISSAEATKGKTFNIGVNLKAESWKTGATLLEELQDLLLTNDFTFSRLVIGVNPTAFGDARRTVEEINALMAKTAPKAEELVSRLGRSLDDPKARKDVIDEIRKNPALAAYLDYTLIDEDPAHTVEVAQRLAFRSRLIKEYNPEVAKKRVLIIGSSPDARALTRIFLVEQVEQAEVVGVVTTKFSGAEYFPFIIRESQLQPIPGARDLIAGGQLLHLGFQDEAFRVFNGKKDFKKEDGIIKGLRLDALAPDVVYIDSEMINEIGDAGIRALTEKNIRVVVDQAPKKTAAATFIPGAADEKDALSAEVIRVGAVKEAVAASAVDVLSRAGKVLSLGITSIESSRGGMTSTYKTQTSEQIVQEKDIDLEKALKARPELATVNMSTPLKYLAPISRGITMAIRVNFAGKVDKKALLEALKAEVEKRDIFGLPEAGVAPVSNIFFGEKKAFVNPNMITL
ncbi:MAG: triose-phosphate isomerase, partial [Candidatus Omnitrophica bacterium]|nr:triose-phosphate isomerase [Candidatus Omnitrophota bacterium]